MAINQFNLPDLGEGLTEGEILKWLVAEGDVIELNQPIVEVETAKAAVEIPAKWAGTVERIFHPEGTTVEVGHPIISINTGGDSAVPLTVEEPAVEGKAPTGLIGEVGANGRTAVLVGYGPRTVEAKRKARKGDVAAPAASASAVAAPAPVAAPAVAASPVVIESVTVSAGVLAKPPVRKLARDLGIDLATIVGTGPQGSITRDDLAAAADAPAPVQQAAAPAPVFDASREQRIPIKGVRKLTAANMVASAFTAPHVTEFLTVDMTRTMKALDRLKARPEWRDVRVSPLLLVAKAVLLAAKRHPMVNSTWSAATEEIVVKDYINLGIAAATERGLIVPNIKDAGSLTLRQLADAMTDLVQTAKSGKTPPAAMSGGTFTITNVGVYGVDTGTPILPPGEAAILALGTVREQPWAHKGKTKLRQVTTLGLSFDHRIIDGELGSKFLRDIGAFLTDPEVILLAWT
ncbi:pyruvate dehydrogenase E2 component (dihydrolipoamide acetyltransferase) [Allocatelliglobosispora scoriae]|uniref:Dihydrolipoamide acetyltransferase component of pyruvate dehydrogenase complex n=2 Tax=Allocatelliglobosispora scoriae TaxID=643052 RepID=A0A841BT85_9ACTN|nr:dihydrolipoamide acetyltransferase family protein [Allocatelliglobosispora scoriae]MBB5870915.1 pyruvate dehydrogenase E2 component (dihydrolipoamide acetyltransferase) [Allocatelliglobosispora scoriae]